MASGKTHDRIGLIASLAGAGLSIVYPPLLPISIGCFATTWWFSPDLDVPSRPWRRWGMLRHFWTPYQLLTKHRGLSHRIILGTLSRLVYLSIPIVPAFVLLGIGEWAIGFLVLYKIEALLLLAGLEVGAWLHLWADRMLIKKRKSRG